MDLRVLVPCQFCCRSIPKKAFEKIGTLRTCECGEKTRKESRHCADDERNGAWLEIQSKLDFYAREVAPDHKSLYATYEGSVECIIKNLAAHPLIQYYSILHSGDNKFTVKVGWNKEPVYSNPDADGVYSSSDWYVDEDGSVCMDE